MLFHEKCFILPDVPDIYIYNYIHLVGLEKALFSEKQSSSHRIGNDHVAKERKRERTSHRKKTEILSFKSADIKSVMKLRNKEKFRCQEY